MIYRKLLIKIAAIKILRITLNYIIIAIFYTNTIIRIVKSLIFEYDTVPVELLYLLYTTHFEPFQFSATVCTLKLEFDNLNPKKVEIKKAE